MRLHDKSSPLYSPVKPENSLKNVEADPIPKATQQECSANLVTDNFVTNLFDEGCQLLRVTRKKARIRTFVINPTTGVVSLDGTAKFSVDSIRDVRVGAEAAHYRELCKISIDQESRWLSIIYYIEGSRIKVLHVVCPSSAALSHFRTSLITLHRRRSHFVQTGQSFFDSAEELKMDEDTWQNLIPDPQSVLARSSSLLPRFCEPFDAQERAKHHMSFEELELLCQKLQFHAPEAFLRRIFDEVDINKSGHLDFTAFKQFVAILKVRPEVLEIYNDFKHGSVMTRMEFYSFLENQGVATSEDRRRIFERAREPTSLEEKELISSTNFTSYMLSRQNALQNPVHTDMTHTLNAYFISSSHNTYLTRRQVGDESSIEPYVRVLHKGCRCIEIDIWSNSDGIPEVRHGHAFTSAVPLSAVLKVIEKHAFLTTPWPLIISLEIRCNAKVQQVVLDMLLSIFGDSLMRECGNCMPTLTELRHKILLKIKSAVSVPSQDSEFIGDYDDKSDFSSEIDKLDSPLDDSPIPNSLTEFGGSSSWRERPSRSSSASSASSTSSRSSSYSSVSNPYRALTRSSIIIAELTKLAPYFKGLKLKNFSLPESKVFNHIFSLSERTLNRFLKDNSTQVKKHNTNYMMRVYPSQARLMSSNFLPHAYWLQGVQMVAMNWQTYDLGMQINEAFFSADVPGDCSSGYVLKPTAMRSWIKGQEHMKESYGLRRWTVTIISGTQLSKGQVQVANMSPFVELEIIRPASKNERESKFKTQPVDSNAFNPRFDSSFTFELLEDEHSFFCFLRFTVKDAITGSVLGLATTQLDRMQKGYRPVNLCDAFGESLVFSALLIKVTRETKV